MCGAGKNEVKQNKMHLKAEKRRKEISESSSYKVGLACTMPMQCSYSYLANYKSHGACIFVGHDYCWTGSSDCISSYQCNHLYTFVCKLTNNYDCSIVCHIHIAVVGSFFGLEFLDMKKVHHR